MRIKITAKSDTGKEELATVFCKENKRSILQRITRIAFTFAIIDGSLYISARMWDHAPAGALNPYQIEQLRNHAKEMLEKNKLDAAQYDIEVV